MSINKLAELTTKYLNDSRELENQNNGVVDAERKLKALENDTNITYESMSRQSIKLNRQLEKAKFQHKAIKTRLQTLRSKISPMIEAAQETQREAELQAVRDRRTKYDEILASDEWKAIQHKMVALAGLQGNFWGTVERELICYKPTDREAEQAARDLGLWIDEPTKPDEIEAAEHAIGYNDVNRGGLRFIA